MEDNLKGIVTVAEKSDTGSQIVQKATKMVNRKEQAISKIAQTTNVPTAAREGMPLRNVGPNLESPILTR